MSCSTKKKLLTRLLIEDDKGGYVIDFLKSIDMRKVVNMVGMTDTIRKSWRKIVPCVPKTVLSTEGSCARAVGRFDFNADSNSDSVSDVLAGLYALAIDDRESLSHEASAATASTKPSYAFWRGIRIRPLTVPPTALAVNLPGAPQFSIMICRI